MRKLLLLFVVLIAAIAGSMIWAVRRSERRAAEADLVNARATVSGSSLTRTGGRTGADALEPAADTDADAE